MTASAPATFKDKNVAAGWSEVKPHTKEERVHVLNKHGKKCFLRPGEMKYPVCDLNGTFDCRGIIAAKFWADTAEANHKKRPQRKLTRKKRPYSFRKVSKTAKRLGKKLGCRVFARRKL